MMKITRAVMGLLSDWKVSAADQIDLLALPDDIKPRMLSRFTDSTPLPNEPHIMERVDHLFGIEDALRTSYPRNPDMGSFWMNKPNKRFKQMTPLRYMLDEGIQAVVAVRMHLDCAYDWFVDETNAKKT